MMPEALTFLILTVFLSFVAGAPECDDGWTNYKGEICVKAFDQVATYEEALEFCSTQGDAQGSLVMVKDAAMQQFLVDITEQFFDYIWLGAKYDGESSQLMWQDGSPLTYTNWQDGYPKDIVDGDACLELRPGETRFSLSIRGKWAHLTCKKRNLVMCQKSAKWTLDDTVAEIIRLKNLLASDVKELAVVRHDLQQTKYELTQTKNQLTDVSEKLTTVTATVVPVGSIYVEYYNQSSPQSLWPSLTWEDITNTYAGLFFRASGSASAGWGTTQEECAPRIITMEYGWSSQELPISINLPGNGWSSFGKSGYYKANPTDREGLRFYTAGCEVRPRNQAIRIWKRTS